MLYSNSDVYKCLSILVKSNREFAKTVVLPFNKIMLDLLNLLLRTGYVHGIHICTIGLQYYIRVSLVYSENRFKVNSFCFISKPGRRVYVSIQGLRRLHIKSQASLFILLSSCGLISGQEALSLGVGGELLVQIN